MHLTFVLFARAQLSLYSAHSRTFDQILCARWSSLVYLRYFFLIFTRWTAAIATHQLFDFYVERVTFCVVPLTNNVGPSRAIGLMYVCVCVSPYNNF